MGREKEKEERREDGEEGRVINISIAGREEEKEVEREGEDEDQQVNNNETGASEGRGGRGASNPSLSRIRP